MSDDEVRARLERLASIGARAAEVAHELRNALAVLETSLHLVRRAVKGSLEASKAEPHLARIAEQVHAGQAIVREVLDESRDALDLAPVDLRAMVLEVVAGAAHPDSVRLEAEAVRAKVVVDARQIRQLLLNLVRNAIEALTPPRATPRPGTVRVTGSLSPDGMELRIEVEDDGPGIDATVAARLFQPFASGKRGGTGLGLAVCRRIATAHGGELHAEPRVPRGTRMRLTLPLPIAAKMSTSESKRGR
ncbi:MAG: hypothetical protein NVSMB47_06190 [Polyangiales bacterium]